MTEREAADFYEVKRNLLEAHPVCCVCGLRPSVQLAHRIPQSKMFIRKYGKSVIHDPLNLVPVCGLYCNARANIGGRPAEVERLARIISEGN